MRRRKGVCPACGQPLARTEDQCPACNYSRGGTRTLKREFWGAMAIFCVLFAAGIVAALMLAHQIQASLP